MKSTVGCYAPSFPKELDEMVSEAKAGPGWPCDDACQK